MNLINDLIEVVRVGDLDGVEKLLSAGADVHFNNDQALCQASYLDYVGIVKALLSAGANVHAMDDLALYNASMFNNVEVVKVLLEAGADVRADNDRALCWACYFGHIKVVIELVEAGASLRVLQGSWTNLFGCKASKDLTIMSISEVVELLCSEAVRRELV